MLDTIAINLTDDMYIIFDKTRFHPLTQSCGRIFFRKWVRNPSKGEISQYGYLPRLTFIERPSNHILKVEFSAPKLIFGNNFDELEEKDFEKVIDTLKMRLKLIGVNIFERLLVNAPISAIHYSKNIPLTDGSIPYSYLKELSKINLNQRLDLNQTDFRNEGHSLKFRSNTFEIAFYDKLKDLKQARISEKKSIEKDNYIQLNLFEEVKILRPFEVLRLEIRFNNRQTIKQKLKLLKIDEGLTFNKLFNKTISQKVLLYYWQEIINSYPAIIAYKPKGKKDLLSELIVNNPDLSFSKLNQIIGAKTSIDEMGIREYREITKKYDKTSWYRLNKELKSVKLSENYQYRPFKNITNSLQEYKPLKLVDYKDRMLNNDKYE